MELVNVRVRKLKNRIVIYNSMCGREEEKNRNNMILRKERWNE